MPRGRLTRNATWLIVSLVLCLVSAVGAAAVQTRGGAVTVKDMQWETSAGRMMNALLLRPDTATADAPAPAVVVSHGWWNNREMQSANYVELARRGYVVVSVDMYGHGNSDPLPVGAEPQDGTGMYAAVELLADLPYVDAERIGVSGHSNGARAANFSVAIDEQAEEPLIASVFLVDNEAFYRGEDESYANVYGSRDVGLVADQYDEFFFRSYAADGSVLTPPREFAGTPDAQSFLHFGEDPDGLEERVTDELYRQPVDGREAVRVLHTPQETHPWGTISATTVGHQLAWFEETLGAPEAIPAGSQVWQVKEAFTTLGLVGFGIFLVTFTRALLGTQAFAGLRAGSPVLARTFTGRGDRTWFWGGLLVAAVFSAVSYVWLSQAPWLLGTTFGATPEVFPQGAVFFVALWAAVNGVFGVVVMTVSYLLHGRRGGVDLRTRNLRPGPRRLLHGVALAATSLVGAFLLVFAVHYFFLTDFRFWVVAVKYFPVDKIGLAAIVFPLFAIYFVANSVAVNSFNHVLLGGREWLGTAVLAVMNVLGPLVLVVLQYVTFAVTGDLVPGFGGIYSIWLFPVLLILAVSAVVTRKIYRATGSPYIGGLLNAGVVSLISVSNSLVYVPA